jgi:hypothetical protein
MEFVTRKKIEPPVVYQDCNVVVTLVTKGGGKLQTKHLRARMHLGKEMVGEGRIAVVYKSAEGMEADGFSKPYDPAKHKPFAAMIQGGSWSTGGRYAEWRTFPGEIPGTFRKDAGQKLTISKT